VTLHAASWRRIRSHAAPASVAVVTLDPDSAWRLLYNALPETEARQRTRIQGDASLAESLFAMALRHEHTCPSPLWDNL